jgi:hypothetical protein
MGDGGSDMSSRAEMEKMVSEALDELGFTFRVMSLWEVQNQPYMWCIDFIAPDDGKLFQIRVQWELGSTYESVKNALKAKLSDRP